MDWITGIFSWIVANPVSLAKGSGIVLGLGAMLSFALKRWVTEAQIAKFGDGVEWLFYWIFAVVTVGLAKWKITKPFWNKSLEGFVILFLREFFGRAVIGSIKGLESDNPSLKE